jgi:adenine-specific DNA-methyltransferase
LNQLTFAESAEYYRIDVGNKLEPKKRSALGQYMTPVPIARYMASLFEGIERDVRLLDAGAGVGSLTAAFGENLINRGLQPSSIHFTCYEIEPILKEYLENTLEEVVASCRDINFSAEYSLCPEDFIECEEHLQPAGRSFTHAILNPPYKKINANSSHRLALRKAGLETSNLYTGFLYLAAKSLCEGGELVAIVPRSFCNGPYFKPFREKFFSIMTLKHIHIFDKRNSAFKGDDVLQENIIFYAVKGKKPGNVSITASPGPDFEYDSGTDKWVAQDMTQRVVEYSSVIGSDDPDKFVHITTNELEQAIVDRMTQFSTTLKDIGIEVSTGPVVDFRLKEDLRLKPESGSAPLLYADHFRDGKLKWPKEMKKPNAIQISSESRKWLWSNQGHFVITRRFSTKEEKRRIVASVYSSELPGELIGFENHLNVFHDKQQGLSKELAVGLSIFLNSSLVDRFFRQFNGHTQVNATDLRSLNYPDREALIKIGEQVMDWSLSQLEIDNIIDGEFGNMADESNPMTAQNKIDEALEILKALGMPKSQHNERSALTLLALADLKPDNAWNDLKRPLIGITPIMDYIRDHYGKDYAPNTRETIRRQTMHQFVEAGIALYNPDEPDRPVNSPKACYQISEQAYEVVLAFGSPEWKSRLDTFLKNQKNLAEKWAKHREMQMIPVQVAEGQKIKLSPGAHSELIKQIITEFAPRFAPNSELIYVGDTEDKIGFFEEKKLSKLGVTIDQHGKIPDVVLYFPEKNWLLLIESVTSHGPMDAKRHNELSEVFSGSNSGLVFVTAFPDRNTMGKYLSDISWETEVWCADAPTHLIHFNGDRFLGPHE